MKLINQILVLLLLIGLSACHQDKPENLNKITRQGLSMGTTLEIQIVTEDKEKADSAITAAFIEIQRISDKYSTYQKDNYIYNINNSDSCIVDEETAYLLQLCDSITTITKGRFDIAVGNLVKLIGFEAYSPKLPPQDSIDILLASTGWKNIDISNLPEFKNKNKVQINFGGIAKGYAVDRAAEVVHSFGFDTYMVNAGGEIQAKGKEWSVGITHPREQGEVLEVAYLKDISIATSGDYEKYFKNKDKRFSHIIDPVTGLPSDKCQSVSIITDDCVFADGLATGFFVLGAEESIKIVNTLKNVECLIIDTNGKRFVSNGLEKSIYSKD